MKAEITDTDNCAGKQGWNSHELGDNKHERVWREVLDCSRGIFAGVKYRRGKTVREWSAGGFTWVAEEHYVDNTEEDETH